MDEKELIENVDKAFVIVAGRIRTNSNADEALKYTQALVNASIARGNLLLHQQQFKTTKTTKGAGAT